MKKKAVIACSKGSFRDSLSGGLGKIKFEVYETGNGNRALETILLELPDLIVIDSSIKLITPDKLVQIIRANPRTGYLPIIVTSEGELQIPGFGKGNDLFMKKPLNFEDLALRVEGLTGGGTPGQDRLTEPPPIPAQGKAKKRIEILDDGDEVSFMQCPHCTIQITSGLNKCPHCEMTIEPEPFIRRKKRKRVDSSISPWKRLRAKKFKGMTALFVLLGLLSLGFAVKLIYRNLTGVKVIVAKDSEFKIKDIEVESVEGGRVVRGSITNNVADVPAISLKSIGVRTKMVLKNGGSLSRTVFPVGPLDEPGALLKGQVGDFSIELPDEPVKEIRLRAEVIDLRGDRKFYVPRGRRRSR